MMIASFRASPVPLYPVTTPTPIPPKKFLNPIVIGQPFSTTVTSVTLHEISFPSEYLFDNKTLLTAQNEGTLIVVNYTMAFTNSNYYKSFHHQQVQLSMQKMFPYYLIDIQDESGHTMPASVRAAEHYTYSSEGAPTADTTVVFNPNKPISGHNYLVFNLSDDLTEKKHVEFTFPIS